MHGIGLLGCCETDICVDHGAVSQHALDGQCGSLTDGDGGCLRQVQAAATDIGTERSHFEFQVVVGRANGSGRCGAELELFGVNIGCRIGGVIDEAARYAGKADRAPWGGDI